MTPIKLKIIEIKADALEQVVKTWAIDNKITLPEKPRHELKRRLMGCLFEME